jgi:hypothetical protein
LVLLLAVLFAGISAAAGISAFVGTTAAAAGGAKALAGVTAFMASLLSYKYYILHTRGKGVGKIKPRIIAKLPKQSFHYRCTLLGF